jgi:membrane-associated phospholipid phosphatase
MKFLFFVLMSFSSLSFAGNLLIPTCDLLKNKDELDKLSFEHLNEKANTYLHRRDHCDAASVLLSIYTRNNTNHPKSSILRNLFLSLKDGKFLNEYTSLLLGHGKLLDKNDVESVLENLSILYTHFITYDGTNPSSQFYVGSRTLSLLDEAEVQFRFFITNFPKNSSSDKIKKALAKVYDRKLYHSMEYIKFYSGNEKFIGEIEGRELYKLMRLLEKGTESKYFKSAMKLLDREKFNGAFSKEFIAKLDLVLREFFDRKGSPIETARDLTALLRNDLNKDSASSFKDSGFTQASGPLTDFLIQKGNDKSVFFPLSKDFNFSATKTLISLGAVGIIMVFDGPIMDFIQRNKDAGILDEVANYGNHFGEMSGLLPVVLGTLSYGLVFDNNRAKNAALSSIGAVVLGQLVIETLKSATHRSRPEAGMGPFDFRGFGLGSDNTSFASGHSAAAWSVASVFAEEYGDEYKWAPAAAYGLAALTSYARMNKNKHWASDVVMGAMVGYVAGKIFHKFYRETFKDWAENITITPMIGRLNGIRVEIREKMYADLKKWPLDFLYRFQRSILLNLNRNAIALDEIYTNVYIE